MGAVESNTLELGMEAPEFRLTSTDGSAVALNDFADAPALLVVFICNHCPFVKHIGPHLASFGREFMPRGLAIVGINSNDAERYPEDSFEAMVLEKARVGYPFPYLHDPDQHVARAYGAVCTPDFFLFDDNRELVYRGRYDDTRPGGRSSPSGDDLRDAVTAVLTGREVTDEQYPSLGCGIKWRPRQSPA